jgi:hypothetical protein
LYELQGEIMSETKRPLILSAEGYTLVDTAELKRLKNIEDRGVYKLRQLKEVTEDRFAERRQAHIEAIAFVLGVAELGHAAGNKGDLR